MTIFLYNQKYNYNQSHIIMKYIFNLQKTCIVKHKATGICTLKKESMNVNSCFTATKLFTEYNKCKKTNKLGLVLPN